MNGRRIAVGIVLGGGLLLPLAWVTRGGAHASSASGPTSPETHAVDVPTIASTPAPEPTASPRAAAIARSMVVRIAAGGTQAELRACYDAIRRLGADAVPVLLDALREPELALAALNALEGLRAATRPWRGEWTDAMVKGAADLLASNAPHEQRRGAVRVLYALGDAERLLGFACSRDGDAELRREAFGLAAGRLKPEALASIAADVRVELSLRLRAGIACDPAFVPATLASEAQRACFDPASPERIPAIELYGRLEGVRAHAALAGLLRVERDDAARCAILTTLSATRGLERARGEMEAIAREKRPSTAKLLARKLLQVAR